jgi:RecA/RadA recombinase
MTEERTKVSAIKAARLKSPFTEDELLHTGSLLLNLSVSGNPNGGILKGRYFYLVGDSSSGKTFFTLTALAEASINPAFDDYRLIYDDVEGGALMDVERYFGGKLADRIEPPSGTKDRPIYSALVEEFYFHLDDAFNRREPFIYVLDSQDALDSLYSQKKFRQLKIASRTDTKAKGDYGDGKAKFHSTRIRSVVSKLRETGSILILVNQTRDVISTTPFGPKTQASGGRALKFYAAAQIWTSVKGKLVRTINKKKRQVGIEARVSIKKNRISGKEWSVVVPIYFSHGIDDIGSCVEFLADEGRWGRNKKTGMIRASDFDDISGNLDTVVRKIEELGLENEVREITAEVFQEIEEAARVVRKRRYE